MNTVRKREGEERQKKERENDEFCQNENKPRESK